MSRVCDLGGGTGYLLQKFLHVQPYWLNVDSAQKTLDEFNKDYIVYKNKDVRNADVRQDGFLKEKETYDLFVASFVISSLDTNLCYSYIKKAMHHNSIFIIADNHFSYVQNNPMYGFDDVNNENIAISPTAMHRELIIHRMKQAGFIHLDEEYVSLEDGSIYSQIHAFKIEI